MKRRAEKWCQEHGNVQYYETSAKEATNVETAFQELTKIALKKFEDEPRYTDCAPALLSRLIASPQHRHPDRGHPPVEPARAAPGRLQLLSERDKHSPRSAPAQ